MSDEKAPERIWWDYDKGGIGWTDDALEAMVGDVGYVRDDICDQLIADRLAEAEARERKLREALEPFQVRNSHKVDSPQVGDRVPITFSVEKRHILRARAALTDTAPEAEWTPDDVSPLVQFDARTGAITDTALEASGRECAEAYVAKKDGKAHLLPEGHVGRIDAAPSQRVSEAATEIERAKDEAVSRALHTNAPEDAEVAALCERIGYGAVMDAAARLWARKDPMGAFYIAGDCLGRRALTKTENRGDG